MQYSENSLDLAHPQKIAVAVEELVAVAAVAAFDELPCIAVYAELRAGYIAAFAVDWHRIP